MAIRKKTILAPFLFLVCIALWMVIEPYCLQFKAADYRHPDIPPAFDGTTIVFLTDIHHGPFFSLSRVKSLVERVNRLKPDLILLGGDYVLREARYIGPVFSELSRLSAPLGVYGVFGNHDHWEGIEASRDAMRQAGIRPFENDGVWISNRGAMFRLGGVEDLWCGKPDFNAAAGNARAEDFVLILSHEPDAAMLQAANKADLLLSGHTHGGQVTLFGLYAPLVPSKYGQRFRAGWTHLNGADMLVSTGIGTITPPLRFFAPPEVWTITLRTKKK